MSLKEQKEPQVTLRNQKEPQNAESNGLEEEENRILEMPLAFKDKFLMNNSFS